MALSLILLPYEKQAKQDDKTARTDPALQVIMTSS